MSVKINMLIIIFYIFFIIFPLSIVAADSTSLRYRINKTYRYTYSGVIGRGDSTQYYLNIRKKEGDSIAMVRYNFHLDGRGFLSRKREWMPDSFFVIFDGKNGDIFLKDDASIYSSIETKFRDTSSFERQKNFDRKKNSAAKYDTLFKPMIVWQEGIESFFRQEAILDVKLIFCLNKYLFSSDPEIFFYFDSGSIDVKDFLRIESIQTTEAGRLSVKNYFTLPCLPIPKGQLYKCSIMRTYDKLNYCTEVILHEIVDDPLNSSSEEFVTVISLEEKNR